MEANKKYTNYVLHRLEEYGFNEGAMYPKKYTAYTQINGIVKLRLAAEGREPVKSTSVMMTNDYCDAAVRIVDEILPPIVKQRIAKEPNESMVAIHVAAHPYANTYGTILVPKEISDKENIAEYITDHFNEIDFGEPDLDYCGTEYEISIEGI